MNQKIVFIDRDGVINKDPGGWTRHNYVTDPKDLHFIPGSLEALKLLKNKGFRTILISNQAGVGKGYFTLKELEAVNRRVLDEVRRSGGDISETYYCVHRQEDNCSCRKPKTGLFDKAIKKYGIDPRTTYFIGDSYVDMSAGKSIGARTIFVRSGKYTEDQARKWVDKPDYIFDDLLGAVKWILGKDKRKSGRAAKREVGKG